jgi:hypothetical protein
MYVPAKIINMIGKYRKKTIVSIVYQLNENLAKYDIKNRRYPTIAKEIPLKYELFEKNIKAIPIGAV